MKPLISFVFTAGYFLFSMFQLAILALLPRRTFARIYSRLDEREFQGRIDSIGRFVHPGDDVLDVGSGSGRFGKRVQQALNVSVTGVDVCDYADSEIKFFLYDGRTLPFPDATFDAVFLVCVLHHVEDQDVIFREVCRVAKKKVVVIEDTFDYRWERLFTCWNDYHTNVFQGWIKAKKGFFKSNPGAMPMPLTFRNNAGWRSFFRAFPVDLKSEDVRKMGYKPHKKTTFLLEKIG